jgi:hypothetical protein
VCWARSCFPVAAQAVVGALAASLCPFKAEPPPYFPFPLFPAAAELFGPPVKLAAPAPPQPASSRLQGHLVLVLPLSPLTLSFPTRVGRWSSSPSRPSKTPPPTPPPWPGHLGVGSRPFVCCFRLSALAPVNASAKRT